MSNKMVKLVLVIFLASMMLGFSGTCATKKKDKNTVVVSSVSTPAPAVIPDTTKMITSFATEISKDNSALTFTSTATDVKALAVGDIMVGGVSEKAPNGFLQKVSAISEINNQLVVSTTQATLEDAIQDGIIELNQPLAPNAVNNAIAIKGATLGGSIIDKTFSLSLDNVVIWDADVILDTTYDQVIANGSFTFSASIDFYVKISWFKIKEARSVLNLNENAQLTISSNINFPAIDKKKRILTYPFPPITIPVGPVPVVLTPIITVDVGINGQVEVSISANVSQEANLSVGLQYNNGAVPPWSPVNNFTKSFDSTPPTLSAGLSIQGYIQPRMELLIYGIAGPYADAKGYLQLDANVSSDPWWQLWAGLEAGAGFAIEVPVLGWSIAKYEIVKIINTGKILLKQATDTTAPSVPTGLNASAVSQFQINLSWSASTDNIGVTGYKIYRNGTYLTSIASTSYNNTGLSPSTTYNYTVAAYDAAGNTSAQSSQASGTPPQTTSDTTAPSIPTGLKASAVFSSQINLTWTASTDIVGVTGYKVCRNGTQVGTSATTSYSDTGLSDSTTYNYKVVAYDAAGNTSAQSSQASATTQVTPDTRAPTVPTGLNASAVSSSQINLTWSASSDAVGVTGYKVYRNGSQIGTSATTSYNDTGLLPSSTYNYTVAAYDAAGNPSAPSSQKSATTQASPVIPPAVTTENANNVTPNSARTNGTLNSTGGATCNVWFQYGTTTSFGNSTGTQSKSSTGAFYSDLTGLTSSTLYYYRAVASNSAGTSYGSTATFTTPPTTGNISVTVRGVPANPNPWYSKITVKRYTTSWVPIDERSVTDSSWVVTWPANSINTGTYNFEVYQTPQTPVIGLFGGEFWGEFLATINANQTTTNISFNGTSSNTFTRYYPYCSGWTVTNAATGADVTGQSVPLGTTLRYQLTIYNPGSASRTVRGGVYISKTKSYSASVNTFGSGNVVSAGGIIISSYTFTPPTTGTYYHAWRTDTMTGGGNYAMTDSTFYVTDSTGYVNIVGTPTERLSNGGFESTSNWTWSGYGSRIALPYAGTYSAIPVTGVSEEGAFYQSVTIPSGATSASLSFYLKVTSDETTTSRPYDKLFVEILNSSGSVLAILNSTYDSNTGLYYSYSNLNKSGTTSQTGTWSQKSFNLIGYKGQTIRIRFRGTTDSSVATIFLIDNVSLMADGG